MTDPVPAEVTLQLPPAHTGHQLPAGPLQPPRAWVTRESSQHSWARAQRGPMLLHKCQEPPPAWSSPNSWHRAATGAGGATGTAGTDTKGDAKHPTNGGTGGGKHQTGTAELIKGKHKGREGTCSINILQGNERAACTEALGLHRSMTKNHCNIARKTNPILRMGSCKKHSLPREGNTCSW